MRPILNQETLRSMERELGLLGFSEIAMMEAVAASMGEHIQKLLQARSFRHLILLAGPGSNGADGFAVHRWLNTRARLEIEKLDSRVVLNFGGAKNRLCKIEHALFSKSCTKIATKIATESWMELKFPAESAKSIRTFKNLRGNALVIDAIFGAGFYVRPFGGASLLQRALAPISKPNFTTVALDLPSGLEVNLPNFDLHFSSLQAEQTLCVAGPKLSQIEKLGAERSGELHFVDLGISAENLGASTKAPMSWLDPSGPDLEFFLRDSDDSFRFPAQTEHKNLRGRIAVVGGPLSRGGAAGLCAEAALSLGAGYVSVFESNPKRLKRGPVEWLVESWPQDAVGARKVFSSYGAVVFGPGLLSAQSAGGEDFSFWKFLFEREAKSSKAPKVIVIDGGGLATFCAWTRSEKSLRPKCSILFTPHPKEALDMLSAFGVSPVKELSRVELFLELRKQLKRRGFTGALLLKGCYPICASVEGADKPIVINVCNATLATAGSGDVLSGVLAALSLRVKPLSALVMSCCLQARSLKHLTSFSRASKFSAAMARALDEILHEWRAGR